ncbi:MAG: hypothetical protein ACRDTF_06980 [Pseudonocardiaceae bacterium]
MDAQPVLVVVDARLQGQIEGPARATVTSVAGLGSEVTALALVVTAVLPRLLRVQAAV